MIKTKFDGYIVKVGDREIKVGDRVLMETTTKNDGHGNIYEINEIRKGTPYLYDTYYKVKREDGSTVKVEARWFDNVTRTTYLVEE